MNILVVGSGAREHALVRALAQSPRQPQLWCSPGNPGIAEVATCIEIPADDVDSIVGYCVEHTIDLAVVGPEAALAAGLVDRLNDAGIRAFGPSALAAQIESSKFFAKQLMDDIGVPTARARSFDALESAREYVLEVGAPIVVKADGLAAGKGVVVAASVDEALEAIESMFSGRFGAAGERVVIEEMLEGPEVSVMAFVSDGCIVTMPAARDHKRLLDGDRGPNTGGMGAIAPVPGFTSEHMEFVESVILRPVVDELTRRGIAYRGVLYAGLMMTNEGPKVIEFNARFGDPETQVVLPLLITDFVEIVCSVAEGALDEVEIEWRDSSAACVVIAAAGYPQKPRTGDVIQELFDGVDGSWILHAGTSNRRDGVLVTAGGRVVVACSVGDSLEPAIHAATELASSVAFDGAHYRSDIGITQSAQYLLVES